MVARDTDWGLVTRHEDRALRPDKVDPKAITAAHSAAEIPSGDCHNATPSTVALQALAAIMPGELRSTREICSARIWPATASSVDGPPKAARSPANSLEK